METNIHGTIKAKDFKALAKKYLDPKIRKLGFVGSIYHYNRSGGEQLTNCLQFFPGKYGDSIFAEVGVFVEFLPDTLFLKPKNPQYQVLDCEFRMRVPGLPDGGTITYGKNEAEALRSIARLDECITKFAPS